MVKLIKHVRQTIRDHSLASSSTRVVVALSGGSDSVALAHILRALDAAGDLRVAGVAHFNHQLRTAADSEERFCENIASSLGWPFLADRADVAARARAERRSVEAAARTARHEFLERARLHFDADVVALGHTRDDQAETFLLRLLRGASARGLAAMHPRRGHLIRPLLECRRAELRTYLDQEHIAYVDDESNDDVSIPRNRVRLELVPLLERRFNPAIVDVLADAAALARHEWDWMNAVAETLGARICRTAGDAVLIERDALNAAPPALAMMVVHRAMTTASRGRSVSFQQVQEVLRLSRCGGPAVDLPRHRVEPVGADVVLRGRPPGAVGRPERRTPGSRANLFHYPLSIPGEVQLREAGCAVSVEALPSIGAAGAILGSGAAGEVALVREDRLRGALAVRNRRPGDRFRPLGLDGQKKLQDYFVDRKVARDARDAVPLIVDETDRIVWVAGHSIDEEFRVTDPAQAVLILRLKVLGGPA